MPSNIHKTNDSRLLNLFLGIQLRLRNMVTAFSLALVSESKHHLHRRQPCKDRIQEVGRHMAGVTYQFDDDGEREGEEFVRMVLQQECFFSDGASTLFLFITFFFLWNRYPGHMYQF